MATVKEIQARSLAHTLNHIDFLLLAWREAKQQGDVDEMTYLADCLARAFESYSFWSTLK